MITAGHVRPPLHVVPTLDQAARRRRRPSGKCANPIDTRIRSRPEPAGGGGRCPAGGVKHLVGLRQALAWFVLLAFSSEGGIRMGWPFAERTESNHLCDRTLLAGTSVSPSIPTDERRPRGRTRAGGEAVWVELFAFSFASNHLHLLVRAPRGNLSQFMQYLLSNISKKVGAIVNWRGSFWEHRYSAEPVLDEEALLDRLRYILSHGVKEGLVRHCEEWPGLSCLPDLWGKPPDGSAGSTGASGGRLVRGTVCPVGSTRALEGRRPSSSGPCRSSGSPDAPPGVDS